MNRKKTLKNIANLYVEYFSKQKVSSIFCIPGGTIYPVLDILHDSPISLYSMGHEQSLVHAAEGYSYVSRKPGVVLVTSGPGASNTITGIANAYYDHHAVLVIAGQAPTHLIKRRAFQELDIVGMTKKLCKFSKEARTPDEAYCFLHHAYLNSSEIPLGPSLISIPADLWTKEIESPPNFSQIHQGNKEYSEDLERVIKTLSMSKRPLLLIGQGVNDSAIYTDLVDFAKTHLFPVTSTLHALGAFPAKDPLWLGMVGMYGARRANIATDQCDTLIILGASLNERVTGNPEKFAPNAKIIHVDISPKSLGRIITVDEPVYSSAETFIKAIKNNLRPNESILVDRNKWLKFLLNLPSSFTEPGYKLNENAVFSPKAIYQVIGANIKHDDLVIADCGQHQMWAAQFLEFSRPRQFLTPGGFGTMGFGLPAAIGASISKPELQIWCIVGDGGLINSLQELNILAKLGCNIKLFVINNSGFGMVRQAQDIFYARRTLSDINHKCSFASIAQDFGLHSRTVSSISELMEGIETSPNNKPAVFDVIVDKNTSVYPFVVPNGSNIDLYPSL